MYKDTIIYHVYNHENLGGAKVNLRLGGKFAGGHGKAIHEPRADGKKFPDASQWVKLLNRIGNINRLTHRNSKIAPSK